MARLYRCGIWILLILLLSNNCEAIRTRHHTFRRTRSAQRSDSRSKDSVVFPGMSFKPKIPKECEKIGICDQLPEYPESHVEQLVNELLRTNSTKFNVDELELQIAQRFGEDEKNLELCRSNETLLNPKAAKDANNKWHYVINKVLGVVQSFRVDICDQSSTECNTVAHFARGNKARCKQKFILRNMVAIDYNGKLIEKNFLIPSCCSCVYEVTTL
ncbi:unnamed protein product, partial [Iphiclides podalirius]